MIRILLLILFLVSCTEKKEVFLQANYYISPSGNDGNDGSAGSPWRTLMKACAEATDGDIIYAAAGTYTVNVETEVPDGVSIQGAGIDITIFNCTYNAGPALKLESYGYSGNTNYGNQSISYATFNGLMTGKSAITVNFRSYVYIHHCKFIDFTTDGVYFWGQPEAQWAGTNPYETWKSMPSAWSIGNRFHDNIMTNCAIYSGGNGYGNLRYGSQDGMLVYNNTITQTARAAGSNGYGIKFYHEGWNKNVKVYNNTVTVAPREAGKYNFSIENWNDIGNCEYYNNTLQGQFDFTGTMNLVGSYGSWVHDNIIGFESTPTNTEVGVTPESYTQNFWVTDNWFRNLTNGVILQEIYPTPPEHPGHNDMDNVYIYNNLFTGFGESSAGGRWTYGSISAIGIEDYNYDAGNTVNNVYIWNNTIVASGTVRSNTYMTCGIHISGLHVLTNVQIKNNIIRGFTGATMYSAPIVCWGAAVNTNFIVDNNNFYGNGNSNAPLYNSQQGGLFVPGTGYSYDNNITTNPMLDANYALSAGSGAIGTGVAVSMPTGNVDKNNNAWASPPSMGYLEYYLGITLPTVTTTEITAIGETVATTGGNVTSEGGGTVSARGVVYSTTPSPLLTDSYTSDGTGSGAFVSSLSSLTGGVTYYVRAYATNSTGTAYGNERTFVTVPPGIVKFGRWVIYYGRIVKYGNKIVIR